ncbi:MAG: ABC transporter ATP-binding protein [Dorea sp.]|nr:ABC transporter ATP-binding protein [Dorea sp.]MCI9452893.1 ABC transporter ATP-binding protein [Dorea sp.]
MIFDIKNLTKSFGAHTALSNLSLEIREPGIYGILGPNGAGKSTFLKLMLKILNPTSGEIYYNGTNIKNIGNSYFNEIGAVLEGNRNLYWFMSARENLLYYGRLMGMADRAIRARTEELLTVMELKGHEDKKVGYCSRGMQQKVAIMAALIHSPKILFLDEPTLGLDVTIKASLVSEIRQMADSGTTVFLTTHQIDVLERLTDKLFILENGKSTYQGSVDSLINSQKSQQRTEYLLAASDGSMDVLASVVSAENVEIEEKKGQLHIRIPNLDEAAQARLMQVCVENHLRIISIVPETPTLEEVLIHFWRSHHA